MNREQRRAAGQRAGQPEPITMQMPEPPAMMVAYELRRWMPSCVDAGLDENGNVVRTLVATTMDMQTQVMLSGIGIDNARQIAGMLLAPYAPEGGQASDLLVPGGKRTESGIVLPDGAAPA